MEGRYGNGGCAPIELSVRIPRRAWGVAVTVSCRYKGASVVGSEREGAAPASAGVSAIHGGQSLGWQELEWLSLGGWASLELLAWW